ncbi:hypothetical protein [Streptomyces sp. NPDC002685]|uniref:tetratricopeptide repeat protein n=1 Tax=Streptomyces sp. NPDC002685 TaxID=3154540 RepID=UPI003331DBA9
MSERTGRRMVWRDFLNGALDVLTPGPRCAGQGQEQDFFARLERHWAQSYDQLGPPPRVSPAELHTRALNHVRQGHVAKAECILQELADSGDLRALTDLGVLRYRRGGYADEGELEWADAAERGDARAMHYLGLAAARQGNYRGAIGELTRAVEAGRHAAGKDLGLALLRIGLPESAEEAWQRASEQGVAEADVHLGSFWRDRDDLDRADTWWRQAAQRGNADGACNLGLLLVERGQFEEGQRWLLKAHNMGHEHAMRWVNRLRQSLEEPGPRITPSLALPPRFTRDDSAEDSALGPNPRLGSET